MRFVNKLVDSLTTFHRFSALRTLSSLQEHLIKLIILVSYMINDSRPENYPNNGKWNVYCSRMIDCMIDCLIECMIDILTVFCRLFGNNAMLLIFLFTVLNLAWPVCLYKNTSTYCSIPLGLNILTGHSKGLLDLFICVRRSRNIQHICERCFPIRFIW